MNTRHTWIAALVGLTACVGDSSPVGGPAGILVDSGTVPEGDAGTTPVDADAGEPEVDASVQPRPTCGYAGQACCVTPQAACMDGATCVNATCEVSEIVAVGWAAAGAPNRVRPVVSRFDGTGWTPARSIGDTTGEKLLSVTSFPGGEYRATSDQGRVFALHNETWEVCPQCGPVVTTPISSLFPISGGYWVAGPNLLARCTPTECTDVHEGLESLTSWGPIQLVGSSASDLWFAANKTVYHFDGTRWSGIPALPATLLWANAGNDVWSAGAVGTATRASVAHFDGMSWSSAGSLPAFQVFSMVATSKNDLWVVGASTPEGAASFCQHYDGTTWSSIAAAPLLRGIWQGAPTQVFGFAGATIHQYNGSKWKADTLTLTAPESGAITWTALASKARLPAGD